MSEAEVRSQRNPLARSEIVGQIIERFEKAYLGDGRPLIDEYLGVEESLRPVVLFELVQAELELRCKAGEPIRVESYLARFPQLASDRGQVLALIATEYLWRKRLVPETNLEEYQRRFPAYARDFSGCLVDGEEASCPTDSALSTWRLDDGKIPEPRLPGGDLEWPRIAGYQILAKLGQGGMGVVYRAYDQQRKQFVALKTVQSLDPKSLYRFKQEFRTLADVAHPNLVTLHELVCDGRLWFFTSELVEGTDFLSYVRQGESSQRCSPLPPELLPRLRSALRQLAEGMVALHTAGKLHRDIKPSNVLVAHNGRVVLLDFGLAAQLDQAGAHHSTAPHILGTVAYMAPEQAACQAVTAASDWYSVGVMLFEALTGRLPFVGRPYEVLRQKQERDPTLPTLPAEYQELLLLTIALMHRDPPARPKGEEVLKRLITDTANGATPPAVPLSAEKPVFVGRKPQLQALEEAFEELQRGRLATVLVSGRSGTGKSALVQHFLEELKSRQDVVILSGRCYERELVPYKAVDSLIDELSRYLSRLSVADVRAFLPREVLTLSRLFPVLQRVEAISSAHREVEVADVQELRRRAFAALRELLARLGDAKPLVLSIDDLQWGDADSAALLKEILRPPDPPVLLVIGCHRSEDAKASPFLRAFVTERGQAEAWLNARALSVEPFTVEEAIQLAMTQLDRSEPRSQSLAEHVARESGGSPFFVYELLQSLNNGVATQADDGDLDKLALDEVLWERVGRLRAEARRLLEVVSVAGQPLGAEAAFKAAELPGSDESILAKLRIGRLIRSASGVPHERIEAYHDRVRETVVAHLTPSVLAAHHLHLAEALEQSDTSDPERLAIHWQAAGHGCKAGEYYAAAAARATEALAFDREVRLYRLALELSAVDQRRQWMLQVALADALANAGRGVEAAESYRLAAAGATGAEGLELKRRAAMQLLISGHMDRGIAAIRDVLSAVGMRLPRTPNGALASLLWQRAKLWGRGLNFQERQGQQTDPELRARMDICWSVASGLALIDVIRSADYQARHLLLALRSGEPARITLSLAFEAAHLASQGTTAKKRAITVFARADDLAKQLQDPRIHGFLQLMKGVASFVGGEWRSALDHCDQAEVIFRNKCSGVAWGRTMAQSFCTYALHYLGNIRELRSRLPQLCQEAEERGNLFALANHKSLPQYLVLLASDSPATASDELQDLNRLWTQDGFHVQHFNTFTGIARTALYRGDSANAWRLIEEYWPRARRSRLFRVQVLRVFSLFTKGQCALAMAVAESNRLKFLAIAKAIAARLRRERVAWAQGFSELIDAGVAWYSYDENGAVYLQRRAIETCRRTDMGLHAMSAQLQLGRVLGGDEGGSLAKEAERWMTAQTIKSPERMAAVSVPALVECT